MAQSNDNGALLPLPLSKERSPSPTSSLCPWTDRTIKGLGTGKWTTSFSAEVDSPLGAYA
jgi:hypothetical protein